MARPTSHAHAIAGIFVVMAATVVVPSRTQAAGAAYQVDTSEVSEAGNCKVESWVSWASNRDFIGAVTPTCAFNVYRPLELSAQVTRSRADGEWASGVAPKVKMNLAPSGIGTFGLAISTTTFFDLVTRENTGVAVTIPATMRLSENMRINLNGGWLWDRAVDRHYLTYGVGFDLRTSDNVWTLTTEVFGQAGSAEMSGIVQPRFQAGVRFRPIDRFNIDVIYGRNLAGENANWITVATVVRFPAPEK